jgi:hypothetical protein
LQVTLNIAVLMRAILTVRLDWIVDGRPHFIVNYNYLHSAWIAAISISHALTNEREFSC